MNGFDFHCPTRIVFGPGRFSELGELTAALDLKRVLVVSDPGIEKVGHTQRGVESLNTAGLETLIFDGLAENPTTEHVDAGLAVAKDFQPDAIVAIGGGSSMDCAKGINFLYSCGGKMQDYWGVGKATADLLPMVAVPTTSGTGSEAQSFALISDAETHVKMACGDKRAAFRIAILDPELTLTQPERVTALTGMDAISHAIETMVTKNRSQMSIAFTSFAWRCLVSSFEKVLENPDDLVARGKMQQGACMAGFAIENSMLGAAHAMANPITAQCGVVHGEAIGVVLVHVVRFNGSKRTVESAITMAAYTELQAPLVSPDHTDMREASAAVADYIERVRAKTGLAKTLKELGVEREILPQLAAEAAKQWTGTFNPVEMTADDYLKLYEQAY